jgi:O-antigen ligase
MAIVLTSVLLVRHRNLRSLPGIWLAFLLWGVWAAASLLWSIEPDRTLKEWRNEVFYAGAALWVCFVAAQTRKAERIIPAIVAAAGSLACAIALSHFFFSPERYDAGWHGGPGDHTSALVTLLPCLVMAAWYSWLSARPRFVSLGLSLVPLLFLASAYTTASRTVWPAFAVQFVTIGALLALRARAQAGRKTSSRVNWAIAIAGIAVIGCTAVALSVYADRRPMGFVKGLEHETRLALWPKVIERIAEEPLTGYGFGRGVLRESFIRESGAVDSNLWHAHNLVLEALVQVGVPGLILIAIVLGQLVSEGWKFARGPTDGAAACGIALVTVVAGMLVRNMTDTLLARQNSLLFWGIAGLLLGLAIKLSSARHETAHNARAGARYSSG